MMTLRPISPLVVFLQQGWSHFSYYQQNNCTKFTWKGHHCECQIQHLKSKVSFHIKHWSRFGLLWANFNFWRKNMQKYFWRKISYIPLYFLFQYVWIHILCPYNHEYVTGGHQNITNHPFTLSITLNALECLRFIWDPKRTPNAFCICWQEVLQYQ